MLIDINANIGHWPFRQTKGNTCKDLLERMDQSGIDISVVSNMNGIFYKDTHASNEELFEEISSDPLFQNRFIPFAIINPIYGGWKRDLDISITEMGVKGIRLYPLYHDYELIHPACIELVEMARDRDLAVAFTLRMVDSRSRSWMDIEREWNLADVIPIIEKLRDAKYIVLNIANGIHVNEEETELFKNSNIVFDTSGRNIYNLSELIQKFGKDKFAFGTHSPILDHLTGLLRIESLRESEADEATMELLRSGNAKRILGL
jgi:predicted TIM-barrel fold metal-dependent hydrolase